jgi:hypothetical protein
MLNKTDEIASDTNWSMRRSLVILCLVGVGGWSLLAGLVWLSWL